MIKVIKHGNSIRVYKCPNCECVFKVDRLEYKDKVLIECPECETSILESKYIVKQKLGY